MRLLLTECRVSPGGGACCGRDIAVRCHGIWAESLAVASGSACTITGMELNYKYRSAGEDEWRDVNELIPFAYTDQHFGGGRRWFQCKRSRRLCAVEGRSTAVGSAGTSPTKRSMKMPAAAQISKAQKLRKRLGGSECTDDPFPDKPKGMHWRTYERLRAKGEALDEMADCLGWARLGRLLVRFRAGQSMSTTIPQT
jgi:hypothetical protein